MPHTNQAKPLDLKRSQILAGEQHLEGRKAGANPNPRVWPRPNLTSNVRQSIEIELTGMNSFSSWRTTTGCRGVA